MIASFSNLATFLESFVDDLAKFDVSAKWRAVRSNDSEYLTPEEIQLFPDAVDKVRAQSGAVRLLARLIMQERGYPASSILKGQGGEPIWPVGIVGSLTHSNQIALAAVSSASRYQAIGVDLETERSFSADLAEIIMTQNERRKYSVSHARLFFTIKEAVYKACYHADQKPFSFPDIEVDFAAKRAKTSYGRTIEFFIYEGECVASFAYILA